jgi:hypothetical protein
VQDGAVASGDLEDSFADVLPAEQELPLGVGQFGPGFDVQVDDGAPVVQPVLLDEPVGEVRQIALVANGQESSETGSKLLTVRAVEARFVREVEELPLEVHAALHQLVDRRHRTLLCRGEARIPVVTGRQLARVSHMGWARLCTWSSRSRGMDSSLSLPYLLLPRRPGLGRRGGLRTHAGGGGGGGTRSWRRYGAGRAAGLDHGDQDLGPAPRPRRARPRPVAACGDPSLARRASGRTMSEAICTSLDLEPDLDLDDSYLIWIDPLPSRVWHGDMENFADRIPDVLGRATFHVRSRAGLLSYGAPPVRRLSCHCPWTGRSNRA